MSDPIELDFKVHITIHSVTHDDWEGWATQIRHALERELSGMVEVSVSDPSQDRWDD